jgi:hypothetical protein
MISERLSQQVADLFGIEVPGVGQPLGQPPAGRGLARAERPVEPDDHAYILSEQVCRETKSSQEQPPSGPGCS